MFTIFNYIKIKNCFPLDKENAELSLILKNNINILKAYPFNHHLLKYLLNYGGSYYTFIIDNFKIFHTNKFKKAFVIAKHNVSVVKHIKSDELFLTCVKNNSFTLKYIKNQTDKLCYTAIKYEPYAINYIKNQKKKMCEKAISLNPFTIQVIRNQTPELCLLASKDCGSILEYIREQDDNVCMEIVKKSPWALEYVKNQTREICIEALKYDGKLLEFVKNKTPDLCMLAVKQNGYAIKYIDNQTEELCIEAIKSNYLCYNKYVKKKSKYLYKMMQEYEKESIINNKILNGHIITNKHAGW